MDAKLKQRLVGATILSALAVIFVPMIFEESHTEPGTREFKIPEMPAQLENEAPGSLKAPSDAELGLAPEEVSPPVNESDTASTPETDDSAPLRAWVVQVGSFNDEENANALRDQIRKAGYPSYVESATSQAGIKYRVRVGPELDRQRAIDQRDRIASKFKLKGIVLPVP